MLQNSEGTFSLYFVMKYLPFGRSLKIVLIDDPISVLTDEDMTVMTLSSGRPQDTGDQLPSGRGQASLHQPSTDALPGVLFFSGGASLVPH